MFFIKAKPLATKCICYINNIWPSLWQRRRLAPVHNNCIPQEQEVFRLINNTPSNKARLTPNCDGFIQNSLISCFINLVPQAGMFKAAGRPEPVVRGKGVNEGEAET